MEENIMKNTRTLISSSLVSLIIILLGMFMLCMSRAPQISFDEPLVEGGGVKSDSAGADDQDFMSLLNDSNDSQALTSDNSSESASSNDDDFMSLLEDNNQSTTSDQQSSTSKSSDEGMDEILRLLELDDNSGTQSQSNTNTNDIDAMLSQSSTDAGNKTGTGTDTDNSDSLEDLLALDTDTNEPTNLSNASNSSQPQESVDELSKEVQHLEGMLSDKTTQAENLQTEISNYDQRINDYKQQSPARSSKKTPVRTVSNYQSTPSRESNNNYSSSYSGANISGDYESAYNSALDSYRNHEYQQAIATFFQLLQTNPRHQLADNCQYWLGECRYAQGKFYQAVVEFNKVFAYDAPDKQDDAQLMLGLAYLKLGEVNNARTEFDWLVSCYYSSEYVNTANRYLGQM
jgi:TolA-binding protein